MSTRFQIPEDARTRGRSGFSVIELVTVAFVIGLVSTLAVVGFVSISQREQWTRAVSDVAGQLQEARFQAISENAEVLLEYDSTTKAIRRKCDRNHDGAYATDEIDIHYITGCDGVAVSWPTTSIRFTPAGGLVEGSSATSVRVASGDRSKSIAVYPSGRIQ